jgi:hypothetical protein
MLLPLRGKGWEEVAAVLNHAPATSGNVVTVPSDTHCAVDFGDVVAVGETPMRRGIGRGHPEPSCKPQPQGHTQQPPPSG